MYKIIIQKISRSPESKYDDSETIYEQKVEDINIPEIVNLINKTNE